MSEPQAPTEPVERMLSKHEMNVANREYRNRLAKALTSYPLLRILVNKPEWDSAPRTESIDFPKESPTWRHTFSRSSTDITVRSASLSDPDAIEDNLTMRLPAVSPGIRYTHTAWGKDHEAYDSEAKVLQKANEFVGRIEQQLNPVTA